MLRLHLVLRQGWDLTLADHQSAAWRDTSAALETALADLFSGVAGDQQIVVAEFRSVRSECVYFTSSSSQPINFTENTFAHCDFLWLVSRVIA